MPYFESFRSAPLSRQIVVVALVFALLCLAGALVYFNLLKTPYEVLFANLRSSDAATIVGDLDKKKAPYRLKDGGTTILVPANLVDATRLDVMSEDLPLKGQVGFELFNKSDMGLTEFAQKINYQRALQGELARTIMTLDSVDTARVHLSLPDPSVFRDDRRPAKASATLVARPGRQIASTAVNGIRRLIAAAVPDLDPSDVVILDEHGDILAGDTLAAEGAGIAVSPLPEPTRGMPNLYAAPQTSPNGYQNAPWLPASASSFWTLLAVVVLVPLVFFAGLMARRGRAGRLSEQERARYVERFRSLLDEGGADVRPTL